MSDAAAAWEVWRLANAEACNAEAALAAGIAAWEARLAAAYAGLAECNAEAQAEEGDSDGR